MQQLDEIKIKPPGRVSFDFHTIWQYRELLYFFVWRDIKVKYRHTFLGIFWSILQPVLMMLFFYVVFFKHFNIEPGINYMVFVFSGLVLWSLFSSGITQGSESLLSNSAIIRKIYFPRFLIPLSSLLGSLIDFLFAFLALVVLIIIQEQPVGLNAIIFFPLGIALTFFSSLGISTLLAALNVRYRDFRYILPFAMQLLFFGSQVIYPLQNIRTGYLKNILFLNPLNGALELFRAPFYQNELYTTGIIVSSASMLFLLVTGSFYFKKTEAYFADLF